MLDFNTTGPQRQRIEMIARALGGRRAGSGWLAFCPAHENSRTPALSISEGAEVPLLVKCHAGCSGTEVLRALRDRGLLGSHDAPVRPATVKPRAEKMRAGTAARRTASALRIWRETSPGESSPAGKYLRACRGLALKEIPRVLRYHPAASHPSGLELRAPAMIARVDDVSGGLLGIHRTYLGAGGAAKADLSPVRASLGPISGGAVHLWPAGHVLAAGEGIESCLAFGILKGLPVWAALSTSGLAGLALPPLPLASVLVIAADNDPAGREAAGRLARRADAEGRAVRIVTPPAAGTDFNDLLMKGATDDQAGIA